MKVKGLFRFLGFIIVSLFTIGSGNLFAQLTVVQGAALSMTPQELVQNYLVGPGVTVSNVTLNGSSSNITTNLIGSFSTHGLAMTQLGLPGGILMTSGKANIAIGPNNNPGAGFGAGGSGDPDLNAISGSTTFDKCVLEFDFVPQNDTVRFRYVFGSEEFFEYCSGFNDAFGFFLSGPGINGIFSNNAINIALMPGSQSNYVTINNVCSTSSSRWDNAGGTQFQYDALTHVFTATRVLTPCSTYHIKLAIADAVDHAYDSGVFLEENSFSSPGVTMNMSNTSPYLGNRALEGCSDVAVSFQLEAPATTPYTVNYTISGTAVNGVDYTQISNSVTFLTGSDSVAVVIHPVFDTIAEGPKTVILKLDKVSCDGGVVADTVIIEDYLPMSMHLMADTTICHGISLKFLQVVTGGTGSLSYHWNISTVTDSVLTIVPDVGQHFIIGTVTDLCPNSVSDTTIVLVHPTPIANAGTNISIPNGTSTTLHGIASGGIGPYVYQWISNPPGFLSNEQNPSTGNLPVTKIFLLTVTDSLTGCQSEPSQVIVAVIGGPLSANPAADPGVVCVGDPVHLYALAGGGSGLYTYSWSSVPSGFASQEPDPETTPQQTTTFQVIVNDGFNNFPGSATVTVNPLPVIHMGPVDSTVCIYDSVVLDAGNPGSAYEWSNGATSRTITITSAGLSTEVQTYQVRVTNQNQCMDSALINVIFSFNACVGIHDQSDFKDFTVFPNPTNGSFKIFIRPLEPRTNVEIYNMTGSNVFSTIIEGIPGITIEKEINISNFSAGIYLIKIYGKGYSGTAKILRQ